MVFNARKWLVLMRLVLTIAFVCSSLSHFMSTAKASGDAIGTVVKLEHPHSAGSELGGTHSKSSASEADQKECIPDGKSHAGHGKSAADCCAAICFDLTILSSEEYREAILPSTLSAELPQSVLAVGPYRFLRPPRA